MEKTDSNQENLFSSSRGVLIPIVCTLICLSFTVSMWFLVSDREKKAINTLLEEETQSMAFTIKSHVDKSVIALRRMAQRWEDREGTPFEEWRMDARHYIEDFAALTTVEWVDETFHVHWVEPLKGNESAIGLDIAFNEERRKALEGASQKNTITLTPPLDLVQGYRAFIAYVPIHVKKHFEGFIVGVYNTEKSLNNVIPPHIKDHFSVRVMDGDELVYALGNTEDAAHQEWKTTTHVTLFNRDWKITIAPNDFFVTEHGTIIAEMILLGGSILSVLIGIALYYAISANRRNKLLAIKTKELESSQSFLELMMDNNPDLVFVKDTAFRIVQANKHFLNLYPEEKRARVIGTTTLEEYDAEEMEQFVAMDRKAFSDGYSETMETINFPDGKRRSLFTQKVRFENAQGEAFILGLGRDVTEREDLIHKLTDSNDELERFAYIASHDLQEPLRMVRSFSELLAERYADQLDDTAKRYIDISVSSAQRMQALIDDLLEYARMGGEADKLFSIDMEDTIQYVKENLSEAIKKNDAIITHDQLPTIMGNPVRFSRVLQNLIGNGIKYQKKESQPKIHIGVEDAGHEWTFSVVDNGIGMKPEYCERIFDAFSRLHVKTEYSGTGMGLTICRKIIENMGGRIWAESDVGKGSRFYFTVPKAKQAEEELAS